MARVLKMLVRTLGMCGFLLLFEKHVSPHISYNKAHKVVLGEPDQNGGFISPKWGFEIWLSPKIMSIKVFDVW